MHDLVNGRLPWWNSDEQIGAPLAGEMQSAALFLPFNLLLGLANGVLLMHMLLEMIAGIAVYYLLKRLSCGEVAAIVGGMLFAANGTFSWITNAAFNPIAFLPLILLGIELIYSDFKNKQKVGWGWVLIAIALALSLYAGFPEGAYLNGLFAGVWALARVYQLRRDKWLSFIGILVLGMLVGVMIAAPILVAFKDYLPYADVGSHNGGFSSFALPKSSFSALFMPYIYGPIFQFSTYDKSGILQVFWDNVGGYLSLSLLFLAIIGFLKSRKQRLLVILIGLWSLLMLAKVYGLPLVSKLLDIVPGISSVAIQRYVPPTFELAVIVIAMLGLDQLLHNNRIKQTTIYKVGLAVLSLGFLLALLAIPEVNRLNPAPHHRLWFALSVALSIGTLIGIVLSAAWLSKVAKYLIPGFLIIETTVLFMIPQLSSPKSGQLDLKPIAYLQQHLGTSRFYSMGSLMPNYSSYYNIASIDTNNLPVAKNWANYITKHLDPNVSPIDSFTGVLPAVPTPTSSKAEFLNNMVYYENVGVAYVMVPLKTFSPSDLTTTNLRLVFSDNTFQIFKLPSSKPYFQALTGDCSIKVISRQSLTAECAQPTSLVRRELFMPGWKAEINGHQVKVSSYDQLFQEINIPKGQADIEFSFAPKDSSLSIVVAALGLLTIIGYAVLRKLR